jgi:dipeptidase E
MRGRCAHVTELLLLSNSTAPGRGFLEHALEILAAVLGRRSRLAFFAHASSEPERYTQTVRDALRPLQVTVVPVHGQTDPAAELANAEALFVGGGNSFRLLAAFEAGGLLESVRSRVRDGIPYLGASAGANLACPTIRTTNDMPIVQPRSFTALGLVPFQINPHYLEPDPTSSHMGESRDERLDEFLEENDVPVLALREGAWLHVRDEAATLGGTAGGRLFKRARPSHDLRPGADLSSLLKIEPRYDTPIE